MTFLPVTVIQEFYQRYFRKVQTVRSQVNRPLTYTEKILGAHLIDLSTAPTQRDTTLTLQVDRVAMQDATAQMALLQFMLTGRDRVAVPTTIHCDHLIIASDGAREDLQQAVRENSEVYQFLRSAAQKYGIGFWKPGSGIIHQVILENYAVPGMLMIGTDSHTPNAGGLGMMAIGVGGADATEVMAGEPWQVTHPKIIGVQLKGKLNGWAAPKDIILKVAQILTVAGGTGCIIEYFGEGATSLSATGKATITNMGAEVGATTSLFPYDEHIATYLRATQRTVVAKTAEKIASELRPDPEVERNPLQYYDELITIDLAQLEPHVSGPHTPDVTRPISRLREDVQKNNWPVSLSAALIGSCTNSSYEDMQRAAAIARQAVERDLKVAIPLLITPGSEQIYRTMQRDGLLEVFEQIGGTVLANACGPCIGQWKRAEVKTGEKNSIITSYNRNFKKRNDDNPETHAFISSPEIVVALALQGRLDKNPLADAVEMNSGKSFSLQPPDERQELPNQGFIFDHSGYEEPTGNGHVLIQPTSQRLALLEPFREWDLENDFTDLFVLAKVKGKCTTDHISPAGRWLAYRGHLDKISDNMFSGAMNAWTQEIGKGKNVATGEVSMNFHDIARAYNAQKRGWIVVAEKNYGEGSSREHAAMSPRYLGCRAIVAKSFARIHETNLKKQGILPLWFVEENDYATIQEDDQITIDIQHIEEGQPLYLTVKHADGSLEALEVQHTITKEQLNWFRAGSALEWIRKRTSSDVGGSGVEEGNI